MKCRRRVGMFRLSPAQHIEARHASINKPYDKVIMSINMGVLEGQETTIEIEMSPRVASYTASSLVGVLRTMIQEGGLPESEHIVLSTRSDQHES